MRLLGRAPCPLGAAIVMLLMLIPCTSNRGYWLQLICFIVGIVNLCNNTYGPRGGEFSLCVYVVFILFFRFLDFRLWE